MTSLLRLLSFNVSIQPERYPVTIDPDVYDPTVRREAMILFLIAAGVDLDLICLQAFILDDFKLMTRRLPSFHGFISPESGSAILARKTSFESLHFEDHGGAVQLTAVPVGAKRPVEIWSVDLNLSTDKLGSGPLIVAGAIEPEELQARGFVDALRKVGNFEPTRPFDHGPSVTDYLFIQEAKPVSGDVNDTISSKRSNGHLWSIKSEVKRIEAVLTEYGSDHLPIRATIRI